MDSSANLLLASAREQATAVAAGEITAVQLLELVKDRYDQVNPAVNAVVVTQFDQARSQAVQADVRQEAGQNLGPLHGVPMTIKESWDWVGTASTSGNKSLIEHRPERNSLAVQRLIDAGAIIYGKTNLPLNMADWQTFNQIYGVTNNPWDVARSPGGSSGGAAAALAVGVTALELGSDIAGSIRNPAHCCGVYGHKPTFGIVPIEGHGFPGTSLELDIGVGGPMARTVSDLRLGLEILAGPNQRDAVGWTLNLPPSKHKDLADIKVLALLEHECVAQDPELTAQLHDALSRLAKLGVHVDHATSDNNVGFDLQRSHHVFLSLLRAGLGAAGSERNYQHQRSQLELWERGDRNHRSYIAYGTTLSHWQWAQLDAERQETVRSWAKLFESYDFVVCPAGASTAPIHDTKGPRADRTIDIAGQPQSVLDQLFWAGLASSSYLPATVAPVGVTASGLPCGLQIIAPHLRDYDSLWMAEQIEQNLGGFVAPPGW